MGWSNPGNPDSGSYTKPLASIDNSGNLHIEGKLTENTKVS
jgi:hypothetical protein